MPGEELDLKGRSPPQHGCWLSTINYPVTNDDQEVTLDGVDACKSNECLWGIIYDADDSPNTGLLFYKMQAICVNPNTNADRKAKQVIAESDPLKPTYIMSGRAEYGVTKHSGNTACYTSKRPPEICQSSLFHHIAMPIHATDFECGPCFGTP